MINNYCNEIKVTATDVPTELRVKRINSSAVLPTKGSEEAAGYDLYALNDVVILSHETELIHTGIAVEIPKGYFGGIYARSGIATKRYLRPANCTGVIDSDYRGEVMVALHNDSDFIQKIEAGERIAQLIVEEFRSLTIVEVAELSSTVRGEGGFGSTGK